MTFVNLSLSILWSMFLISNQPVNKIIYLCFNMIFIMMIMAYLLKMTWMSMIFIMLMISGLLVLFFYLASIQQVHKNTPKLPTYMLSTITMSMLLYNATITLINSPKYMNSTSMNVFLNIFNSFNFNIWIITLFFLLFIFMLINLELISNFNSPLRSKSN